MFKKISLVVLVSLFCLTAKACPFNFGDKVISSCIESGIESDDGYYQVTLIQADADEESTSLAATLVSFYIPKDLAVAGEYPLKLIKSNPKEDANSCTSESEEFKLPSKTAVYVAAADTNVTINTKNITVEGAAVISGRGSFTINSAENNTDEIGLSTLDLDASFDFDGKTQAYTAKVPLSGIFSCKETVKRTKVKLGAKSSININGDSSASILLSDDSDDDSDDDSEDDDSEDDEDF